MKKRTFTPQTTFSIQKPTSFSLGILLGILLLFLPGFVLKAQTPFNCEPIFYQVIAGQLNRFDPLTSTYLPIGPSNVFYNGIGYNQEDNFIYGFIRDENNLVKIDANGNLQNLGPVTGLPVASYFMGDFDSSGNLYTTANGTLYKVDVSNTPPSATSVPMSGSNFLTADFAVHPIDGKIYAIRSNGTLVLQLDPQTGVVSQVATSGPISTQASQFGAVWMTNNGEFFASSNNSGSIFLVNEETGSSILLAQGTPTNNNDGANCVLSGSVFTENTPALCGDGIDNDGDGFIDCDDSDCSCNNTCANSDLGVLIAPQPSYTTCAISNNGHLDAIAYNGVPGYTYEWSTGQTTASVDGLGVGSYDVTVTDTNGCTATATGTVELHPEGVWLMTSVTANACGSSGTGSAHVSAMLGTPPYTYLWDNGQTTEDATGLTIGDHTVTVTDALGCSAVGTVSIGISPAISLFTTASYETCAGSADATATVIAYNGLEPYSYLWSDGQTTNIAVGLGAGTYGITVTDANGCTAEATQVVELSPEGIWIMTSSTDADCGANNGTAHVGVMTGVPPYTFLWSNGNMTADPTGLAPGTYTVTVTDSNGCFAEGSVVVNSSGSQLGIVTSSTNADCNMGGSATVTVSNGSGSYSYLWSNGETTATISNLIPGTYTVDVTDNTSGCFGNGSVTIEDDCVPTCDVSINGGGAVCPGESVNLSTTPGGFTSYSWTATGGTFDDPTSATPIYTMIMPGTYTISVLVTDANGCSASNSTTVTINPNPTVSIDPSNAAVCSGQSVAFSTTASGMGLSYSWTATGGSFDDPTSATPTYTMMMPGTYTISVLVSYSSGCSASASTQVTIYPNPTVAINPTNPSVCPGTPVAFSATATGTGLTYSWTATGGSFNDASSATPTYTMMMPGTYTVTVVVTDVNGCTASASTQVTINAGPTVSINPAGNQNICSGAPLQLMANATGSGLTYSWTATGGIFDDASSATPTYTMMMPGTYTITVQVTDANGCSASASIDVTVNPGPTVSISPLDASSCGAASIDFTAMATGTGLSYLWTATGGTFSDPTSATPTYTMMMSGTFTVTVQVTDANGCTASASTQVTIYPEITSCSASVTSSYFEGVDISTLGGSDGSASVTVMGGSAPFSYLWSDGQTTQEATGLSAGTYTVTITSAGGCTCEASVTLEDPAKLGDFVWEDRDQDGIQENLPIPIAGVKVTLNGTGNNGTPVMRMMFTGVDGMYMFDGLLPGTYKVTFETPTGYTGTRANFGDDTRDSDADPTMGGMTQTVSLMSGEYNPTLDAGFYLCTNIGDYVWYDENHDGIQGIDEMGVEGVQVKLFMAGFDGVFCTPDDELKGETTTDSDGKYLLECVAPGEYIVSFMNLPVDWTFSTANQGGDDALDSDADPATGKTAPFTVVYGQPDDLTIDAGIRPICDNFFGGGGQIANNGQQPCICPGEIPFSIINIALPTGGSGPIQYMWMSSIIDVPFDTNFWKPIPGAPDAPEYQPGPLFQTTWFIRCSRRLDCPDFVESNTVKICVKDPQDCPVPNPFNADNLDFSAYVTNGEDVVLNWQMGPEFDNYNFFVERSLDGVYWSEIGNQKGKKDQVQANYYEFMDKGAHKGVNNYRIRIVGLKTGINYSHEIQITISDKVMAKVFPNPFVDKITLAPIQNWESDGIVELYDISGKRLATYNLAQGKESIELDLEQLASNGVYLLKVTYLDSGKTTTFKVTKNK